MNWIKENRFLAGFVGGMFVGVVALGYFLYAAKSNYDDVSNNYAQQAAEWNRLKHLQPYPNQENLDKLSAQRKEHLAKVEDMEKTLAAMKLPLEPVSPEQFQDRLKAAFTAFSKKAADKGLVPDKAFYMGFETYQTVPPKPEAAPLLARELKAIEMVLNDVADAGAVELSKIAREELPEEKGKAEGGKKGQTAGKRGERASVAHHGFEINFVAPKGVVQVVLNEIVKNSQQFFIPRLVVIKSKQDKGPTREAAGPGPDGKEGPPKFIVGDELVESTIDIEIVDIADLTGKQPVAAN